MTMPHVSRRTFLRATAAATAVMGFPLPLRAQAKTFKVGVVHPVTGPLAEPGQACRLGAQMAVDAVNAKVRASTTASFITGVSSAGCAS